jgi:hypothetical protein
MQMFVKKDGKFDVRRFGETITSTYNIWTFISIDFPKKTCVLWILSLQIDICHTIFKTGKLKNDTYYSIFKKRHPELCFRVPESRSIASVNCFNKFFFENLKNVHEKYWVIQSVFDSS